MNLTMLTFTHIDMNPVYDELAAFLEMDVEAIAARFSPEEAEARVRYHRRQASRRSVQAELAEAMGIQAEAVFAACGEEGARILLEALRAKPRLMITTHPAAPTSLISEIEDAMAR